MTAADWISDRRTLIDAAPPAPWKYREGAYGDPANGPDHTKLTAPHPEHGEQTIAEGEYDSWSGLGLALAADARTSLPAALNALEAVLKLHYRREWSQWSGDFMYFGQTEFPDLCDHCRRAYPCETVTAITTALGSEDAS